jgi:DNA-binding MarR family transcriptional regulator
MVEIIPQDSTLHVRYLIGKARHTLFSVRRKELAPFGVSPRQANILTILDKLGRKTTLVEMARYTDREINTLSMQMMRMEKDGLVRKTRETPKSTLLSFEMTEKGQKVCKDIYEIVSDKVIISVLSEAERQQMISMLRRIIDAAEKYTPAKR